jgi:hypothetical protein
MVRTINGLPEDYRGACTVLLNDRDPIITGRNLVALLILAGHLHADDDANAELAFHLLYSAAVPKENALALSVVVDELMKSAPAHLERDDQYSFRRQLPQCGSISASFPFHVLAEVVTMAWSDYSWPVAREAMNQVMLAPTRIDYRERALSLLRPGHRSAFMHYRTTGVIMPFGADTGAFTEPNRYVRQHDH